MEKINERVMGMKKLIFGIVLLFAIVAIIGCSNAEKKNVNFDDEITWEQWEILG
jgi:hypothetical protein